MEKAVTVIGKAAAGSGLRDLGVKRDVEYRKDHLKVWRDIYKDVRRQWAEAESCRSRNSKS